MHLKIPLLLDPGPLDNEVVRSRRTAAHGTPPTLKEDIMGIEDLAKQAGDFAKENADKVSEVLKSEQAEGISDKLLDGAADLANKLTGGKFADQVESARDAADGAVGNE
jgi:hypothetical protein